MMRSQVLCGVLLIGFAGAAAAFFLADGGAYWSEVFAAEAPGVRPPRPRASSTTSSRPARATTRTTRPARTTRPSSAGSTTLLHELPRQALFIAAAAQPFGFSAGDRSVDFAGVTEPLPLTCKLTYGVVKETARVTVHDAQGAELRAMDLPVPVVVQSYPDHAKVALAVEPWCDAHFAPLLAQVAGQAARTPVPATSAASPTTKAAGDDRLAPPRPEVDALLAQVEALLAQVDPQRAFLAAQRLHRAVAESGESPQRLAALVRAYSHLGESTRYLYSRHGSAFFARALLYAERLARKHPDLPLAHAARGYAYTLLGQTLEGRAALAKARELAGKTGGELPAWVALADDLNHFRTRALFDRVGAAGDDGTSAPLASYFALLTVEHSGLQTLVINMARLALEHNPGALRVINIMTDNSGVSLQHETTERSTAAQFELLAKLADDPAVPEPVRAAAGDAKRKSFATPALLELLARMDQQPAAPGAGQLLPWGAYGSMARDALFVSGMRRLYFTDRMLAVDPTNRLQAWWAILKDHRFAPALGGFDRTGRLSGRDAVVWLRSLSLDDFYRRVPSLARFAKRRATAATAAAATTTTTTAAAAASLAWIENYEYDSDDTVYDVAQLLWTYKGGDADAIPLLGTLKGEVARSLAVMCPDHPSALAELIVNRWPETRARSADIERDMGGHPQVAFALARAYRSEKRYDDAVRLLERVIPISPDPAIYEELAEIYKGQGDVEKWIATYDKYLAGSEDFGLEHARKNEEVAYALMQMKQHERALKYAEAAAGSFSAWGLRAHAACLTELGRYDEAERVEKACQQRYGLPYGWYRWCQLTGRGDLAAARENAAVHAAKAEASARSSDGVLNDTAHFYRLEGQADRARACWERAMEVRADLHEALQLALLDMEQGKPERAAEQLDRLDQSQPSLPPELVRRLGGVTPPADELRTKVYRAAADALRRCLEDGDGRVAPQRDDAEAKVILDAVGTPYRGNAAYVMGRACELRGKPDDAEWWYRASLDCGHWTFSCRSDAAAGLRRLGKEYYKK